MAVSVGIVTVLVMSAVTAALGCSPRPNAQRALSDREFSQILESFSEKPQRFEPSNGYESDNWVSNERSFQQVIPGLPHRSNGAYIGVGPEQNFTYIAALDPRVAFIVDIRRENVALHLFYKALFEMSAHRAEFLSRLFAKEPLPREIDGTSDAAALLTAVASSPSSDEVASATMAAVVDRLVRDHGLRLSDADVRAMRDMYTQFGRKGPAICWSADDRSWIPSYGDLMTATGNDDRQHSFLATEEAFQAVKRLQEENRIVPVVGDFGGKKALGAIASYFEQHGLTLDVFYTSNVRAYLRGASLDQFESNLAALPADEQSVVVETQFHALGRGGDKPDFETLTRAFSIRSH